MKAKIWEEEDFFLIGGERIDMDPVVVECKQEPIPLGWNFNFDKMPIGNIADIRLEGSELVGDVTWFENTHMNDELLEIIKKDFRFGGYYTDVVKIPSRDGETTRVDRCTLRYVGIVLRSNMPNFKNVGA